MDTPGPFRGVRCRRRTPLATCIPAACRLDPRGHDGAISMVNLKLVSCRRTAGFLAYGTSVLAALLDGNGSSRNCPPRSPDAYSQMLAAATSFRTMAAGSAHRPVADLQGRAESLRAVDSPGTRPNSTQLRPAALARYSASSACRINASASRKPAANAMPMLQVTGIPC